MSYLELFIIAVGLSMDAFAVAVCKGIVIPKANLKRMLIVGAYFGGFQAAMPLIGYFLAGIFADKIQAYDHYIAFILLGIIGGKMIFESFKHEDSTETDITETVTANPTTATENTLQAPTLAQKKASLSPRAMIPLAVATSIDAMAVGVTFAFLTVSIAPAVLSIGIVTFTLSMVGLKIGSIFGGKLKSKAELVGGIILVLMGIKILLEHLGVINF